MRLRYELRLEDAVAFQRYYFASSPLLNNIRRVITWGGAAVLVGALSVLGLSKGSWFWWYLLGGLVGAGIYLALIPLIYRLSSWAQAALAAKLLSESKKPLFGPQELEITEEGLVGRSPMGESKILWSAIEKVVPTAEHTFVTLGSVSAIVLPHKRVLEGDYAAFVQELTRRLGQQESNRWWLARPV